MGRFTPVLAEDAEMIYPAEFIIRHIYPPEYEKPDFEMMDKVPEKSDSIHRIANRFIELYSICDECMITRFELENQETGNSTVYIFEPSDPKTPETGRFFVDIHVEKIPEEFNDKVSQMITDVRNADCSTLQTVSDERNKELLEVSNNQRISQPFVRDVYEGIRKAESIRQEECSALMPDM